MTASIDVLDAAGKKSGTVDLPAEIFDVQVNIPLIHQVVVAQQAAARQGSHSTKTRGEVAGGGAKPYRQKGTGRARQGSIRAPQYNGGGTVHGPTPHGYAQRTPKKMKAAALRGALSDRARDGRVHVVSSLVSGEKPSTKGALAALATITERPRTLVVLERGDDLTWLSLRNVDTVHVLTVDQLNTYDVVLSDDIVFTQAAYEQFASRAIGKPVVTVASSSADATSADDDKPAKKAAAKKSATKKASTKKTAAAESEAAPSDEAAEAESKPAKKAAAKKSDAKKATAKKAAADDDTAAADDAGDDTQDEEAQ